MTAKNDSVLRLVEGAGKVAPEAGPRPDGVTAYDPCSHVANAQRIKHHFGDGLLYVEGIGWHVWGPPWRHDEMAAREIVHGLGRIIAQEAAELAAWVASANSSSERTEREKAMQARFKWSRQTEQTINLSASLDEARVYLHCKADALDADPLLLSFSNGVLHLDTAEFREHRQADCITKVMGCDYDLKATAPTWDKFVGDVFGGDAEVVGWVQRFIGFTLCAKREEHLLPVFWGGGGNGKSTFLGAIQGMFGDYAGTVAPGLLVSSNST